MTSLIRSLNIENYQCNQLKGSINYEIFKDRIDKILKDSELIISGGDYYHLIFQASLLCQIEHGDFYWVEELEHCCCDYVEAINDGKRFID